MSKMKDGPDKEFILDRINEEGFDQALLYSEDLRSIEDDTFQKLLSFYTTAAQALYWYLGMDDEEIELVKQQSELPKKPKLEIC